VSAPRIVQTRARGAPPSPPRPIGGPGLLQLLRPGACIRPVSAQLALCSVLDGAWQLSERRAVPVQTLFKAGRFDPGCSSPRRPLLPPRGRYPRRRTRLRWRFCHCARGSYRHRTPGCSRAAEPSRLCDMLPTPSASSRYALSRRIGWVVTLIRGSLRMLPSFTDTGY
jgi:hypothetical protein